MLRRQHVQCVCVCTCSVTMVSYTNTKSMECRLYIYVSTFFYLSLSLYIYISMGGCGQPPRSIVRWIYGFLVFGVSTPPGDRTVHARRGTRGSGEPRKRRRCRGRRTTLLRSFGFYPVVENRCVYKRYITLHDYDPSFKKVSVHSYCRGVVL